MRSSIRRRGGMAEKVSKEQDKTEEVSWEGKEGQYEDG